MTLECDMVVFIVFFVGYVVKEVVIPSPIVTHRKRRAENKPVKQTSKKGLSHIILIACVDFDGFTIAHRSVSKFSHLFLFSNARYELR
jgi:hypothetical protein